MDVFLLCFLLVLLQTSLIFFKTMNSTLLSCALRDFTLWKRRLLSHFPTVTPFSPPCAIDTLGNLYPDVNCFILLQSHDRGPAFLNLVVTLRSAITRNPFIVS
ncbi:Uncharacterized protein HZ326_19577 [Fusarium oxysporum f. sp. albedinis]|nr:Uncharacterized protein HZ326_19577 [Fusarium oxysporum f. sp. albedinis]